MNTDFNTKNLEKLNEREVLQNLFDDSFLKTDKNELRNHYKTLRKMELAPPLNINFESIDISSLVENLTLACDIVCTGTGTNFVYCGNETSAISGNSKFITKAFLNLLSNAFLYGRGNLVTVKTIEKQNHISIEVQNAGFLPQNFNYGNGLNFVQRICKALGGHFFISSGLWSMTAIMLLPKSIDYKKAIPSISFCDLLNDRLSPVYVEFFGIE